MAHRVVFLDRGSLPTAVRPPRDVAAYHEYATTAPDEVLDRLRTATIAITNKVALRAPELARLPALKLIAVAATGYDCVDVAAARQHGIAVTNVRQYAARSVAEHVFALILALRRNLPAYAAEIDAGAWSQAAQFCLRAHPIDDLHGSTLGIIGAGAIGQATAALGRAFGMSVLYADHAAASAGVGPRVALADLLARADIVSVHCPLTPGTRGLIGRAQLKLMRRHALLINTARGGIVDELALRAALEEGWIGGAGIDVLREEPPPPDHPLASLRRPNFILTPHVAWSSAQALQTLADQLVDNIDAWLAGEPRNVVG